MILSQRQYKRWKSYARIRDTDPSAYRLLRDQWPNLLPFALFGFLMFVAFINSIPAVAWLVAGLCSGVLLRLRTEYLASKEMWAVNRECLDWERVEEILREYERMKVQGELSYAFSRRPATADRTVHLPLQESLRRDRCVGIRVRRTLAWWSGPDED